MLTRAIFIVCLVGTAAVAAQKEPSEPGLALTVRAAGQSDVRVARMAALHVPAGKPPTPFVAAGAFTATFEGAIELRLRDDFQFAAAGRGSVKFTINDQPVLDQPLVADFHAARPSEKVRLNKGKNMLRLEYAPPEDGGEAWFRLYWSADDFPLEPIPPTVLSHNPTQPDLVKSLELRAGRDLLAGHRCLNCHAPDAALADAIAAERKAPAAHAMPELAADAPDLAAVGSRYNQAWLAHWISNPHALRPTATMPRVFKGGGEGAAIDPRAADVAAYLATITDDAAPAAAPAVNDDLVAAGGRVFAHLRCAACHTLPDAAEFDVENGRVPLAYVKAKFKPAALRAFLKEPARHYAWIRMPDFKLADREADELTAFLLGKEGKPLELPVDLKPDARRGAAEFAASGCANCHTVPRPQPSTLRVPALTDIKDWARGCLSADPAGQAPYYPFADEQRVALANFAKDGLASLKRDELSEFANRQIAQLNCLHCHVRDHHTDLYASLEQEVAPLLEGAPQEPEGEGDEKVAPDQSLPILTYAGEKLKPQWTERLLKGELDHRLRPWLRARMPAFTSRAAHLAHGLPLDHGFPPVAAPSEPREPDLADIGRTLSGKEGGFACISCHGTGPLKPVGVFEAPGVNLQYVDERLTRHFYDRWTYNPLRIHKETKMPAFADPSGKTSLKEVLDGDARRQFDAIYHYILTGRRMQGPEN